MPAPKTYRIRVREIIDETPNVRTLRFDKPAGFSFLPGQFVMAHFVDGSGSAEAKARAFSISSSPEDEFIDLTVKVEGDFSSRMYQAGKGQEFEISAPAGSFVLGSDETSHHVMIAGGSGIIPFRSYFRHMLAGSRGYTATLIYSCRRPEDLIFKKEMQGWAAASHAIRVVLTVTRLEPGKEPSWQGRQGRVSQEMVREFVPDMGKAIFYVCGTKDMVNGVVELLASMGVSKSSLRTERWGRHEQP